MDPAPSLLAARRPPTPYRQLLVVFGVTWLLLVAHGAVRRDIVVAAPRW